MLVQRLSAIDEAIPFRARWNQLADGIPFRCWEWLATWWRYFHDRGDLYLLRVTNPSGEVVGIAPWWIEQNPLSGRVVQFLGSGEVCSDYLGVLTEPACRAEVLDALATWLVDANQPGTTDGWDMLQFDGIDSADAPMLEFITDLERRSCTVHRQPGVNCWRIPLPSSWDKYLELLPKPQRKRMRQAQQSLGDAGKFQTTCAVDARNWDYTWNKFVELHQRRRTSLGQSGCFGDGAFGAFLCEAVEAFLRQGQLRLVLVERDQQAMGTLLMFTGGQMSYAYQMGINPEFLADSPGWLVVCASLRAGIDRHESALDLLRGDEPYKGRMGGVSRNMLRVRVVPAQLGAQLRHTAWLTGSALKHWIKTGLHAAGIASIGPPSSCPTPS